jgi:uncharacterized protein (DUF111 family)
MPEMEFGQIGCGAGSKEFPDCPNILRAFLGTGDGASTDEVVEASCNLDDVSAEIIGYTAEILMERGALDVWLTPVQMKKGRPGTMLSFLCLPTDLELLTKLVMAETGTLGVRHSHRQRRVQVRHVETRETPYGQVRFKVGEQGEKPEYEDCRRIAREQNLPCRDVMQLLLRKESR